MSIVLNNAPVNLPSFQAFINQANLMGGFWVEGEWIKLPKDFKWQFTAGFSFAPLVESVTLEDEAPSKDAVVLNPLTFADFIMQYDCDSDSKALSSKAGILEANADKTLALYVTQALDESAWAELLTLAKTHSVKLRLCLAPKVVLSEALRAELTDLSSFEAVEAVEAVEVVGEEAICSHSQIHQVTDIDLYLTTLEAILTPLVIDISEVEASDLLTKLDGQFNEADEQLDFSETDGALLKALAEGKTVILKGRFSRDLIDSLSPFLLARLSQVAAPGKLIMVTENHEAFNFLPDSAIITPETEDNHVTKKAALLKQFPTFKAQIEALDTMELALPWIKLVARFRQQSALGKDADPWLGMESLPKEAAYITDVSLEGSESKTTDFFTARAEQVETVLAHSPFAFLSGLTGVGKSTFVLGDYQARHPRCYQELAQIEAWALDESDEVKTLFIDEANIRQTDYSQFEGLFNTPPSILIDGQVYELSDKHKVIFAGNPVSYGDERRLASLFSRHGGSVLFKPLPPYAIYHRVIQPLLSELDETQSKRLAQIFLDYQVKLNNQAGKIIISPREMVTMGLLTKVFIKSHPDADIEAVARFYAHQVASRAVPTELDGFFNGEFAAPLPLVRDEVEAEAEAKDDFIYTASRQALAHTVDDLLAVRAHRQSILPTEATSPSELYGGLNGLTIEGEPGIGKSVLTIKRLVKQGMVKGRVDEDNSDKDCFYVVPASMSLEAKQALLLKAFNEGNIVIVDEINSSPMMERLVNSLLTGVAPDGTRPKKAGFLLIGTQNPVYMAGRRQASSALKRRMLQYPLPPYTEAEIKIILVKNCVQEAVADAVIAQYQANRLKAFSEGITPPCFRDIIKLLKPLIKQQNLGLFELTLPPKVTPSELTLKEAEDIEKPVRIPESKARIRYYEEGDKVEVNTFFFNTERSKAKAKAEARLDEIKSYIEQHAFSVTWPGGKRTAVGDKTKVLPHRVGDIYQLITSRKSNQSASDVLKIVKETAREAIEKPRWGRFDDTTSFYSNICNGEDLEVSPVNVAGPRR